MTNTPRAARAADTPNDLIPAHKAAAIAGASAYTLARWADRGLLRAWRRPAFKVRFYSEAEVRGMAPRPIAPRRRK